MKKAMALSQNHPISQGYLGWILGLAGRQEEARAIYRDLEMQRSRSYFSSFLMAHVSLGLGERHQAVSWLERAAEERDGLLPFVNVWFALDSLRSDPRFHALLRRMNFPEAANG